MTWRYLAPMLPGQIVSKIKGLNVKKSDSEQVTYSCIKLEIMAGIESLKKDAVTRNKIQLEMLTEKFNTSGANLNSLDSLLIHFFSHLSNKTIFLFPLNHFHNIFLSFPFRHFFKV